MAAQVQPPEAPLTSPPSAANIATETAAAIPPATATVPTITRAQPYAENGGRALATKRQRRPSVRLGEIGDQPDWHARPPTRHPWRISSSKARSLTNLVNGDTDSHENQELEERNHLYVDVDGNTEFGIGKAKAKTNRVRPNWLSRAEGDSREDGDEGYRDFDPSSVHSVDNVTLDLRRGHRTHIGPQSHSHRVSENEFDSLRDREREWEGVRSWLIELGLSRYAPMFEIHEVDYQVLPMLTLEDLKDMGINAVGSRRKMYTAIQKLRKGLT